MTKSAFFVLATVLLALVAATRAHAQLPEKRFVTPDGKRPSGLFAPGVMVGKTLYIAGKGDYKPNEEFPGKVKNCLAEIEKTLKQAGLGMMRALSSSRNQINATDPSARYSNCLCHGCGG